MGPGVQSQPVQALKLGVCMRSPPDTPSRGSPGLTSAVGGNVPTSGPGSFSTYLSAKAGYKYHLSAK